MLDQDIARLAAYGIRTGLMEPEDRNYAINRILAVMKEDNFEDPGQMNPEEEMEPGTELERVLSSLLDEAVRRGLISDSTVERDLFDTRLMDCLMPRPSQVQAAFWEKASRSPREATDWYYRFSQDSDYIRRYRVVKDQKWKVDSEYGQIDITINLSKPEKDPKAIAAALTMKAGGYPKCLLCAENEGYAGRMNHPARQNHRIIPLTLGGDKWGLQYSPYVYYNEHCIVFNQKHTPMKIDEGTFVRLFDFVSQFPHYFLGSNADLPIVGGSILTHDHFQGGHYTFAMAKAQVEKEVRIPGFEDVYAGILHWPLSVLRIRHKDYRRLVALASHVLSVWREYSDEAAFVFARTQGEPHNTITPIARMRDGLYELDLTLRNNITTEEHPLGVYHPHAQYHHIKKENIGLIEVMGLAVLPARLKSELHLLEEAILSGTSIEADERIAKHAAWAEEFLPRVGRITPENCMEILQQEVGKVFVHVLEDAGVFKCTPEGRAAFDRFLACL